METHAEGSARQAINMAGAREGKYLTFSLSGEEYGISILKVKEIIGIMPVTALPQLPDFIKGVINLRHKVIPVIDLRLKFRMESLDYTERTCIIVVEIESGKKRVAMGVVVDSVSDVLTIKENDIEDVPEIGSGRETEFILGMAKSGQGVKILLHIDKVMSCEEVASLELAA